MPTVRINTSDTEWIQRHPHGTGGDLIAYGTDIKGVMYFSTPVEVAEVEHVKFAGAAMIRFDLGPDAPRDCNRWAMYPESYLVSDAPAREPDDIPQIMSGLPTGYRAPWR